jgi:orotidine-5'-phosphate decarboxylase
VGATFPAEIERVRAIAPTLPLLIPGIGAQGGDARATVRAGWRAEGGRTVAPIIVSSSRAVLYAAAATISPRRHAARHSPPATSSTPPASDTAPGGVNCAAAAGAFP